MIPIPDNLAAKWDVLTGAKSVIANTPVEIFDPKRISFLSDLSRRLLKDAQVQAFPDVVSFAYWCRQANLERWRVHYQKDERLRLGLGLTYHICPSNVPVNFAFSMAFGLLSGNTCVLRLPSKSSSTLDLIVQAVDDVLKTPEHESLKQSLMLLRFERDDEINHFWLSMADGRLVWGGDQTVQLMRQYESKPRAREVAFSDRYSLCVIEPNSVLQMQEDQFKSFTQKLYNDIYLMDQAACSSPQLFVWLGDEDLVRQAQSKLWPALFLWAKQKYPIRAVQAMDKFVQACRLAIHEPHVTHIARHDNWLYRLELDALNVRQDDSRGYFGTIHEVIVSHLESLAPMVNERYQTLLVQGIELNKVREMMVNQGVRGIDRVVSVGRALDMDFVWDGYDIIHSLSRLIAIE